MRVLWWLFRWYGLQARKVAWWGFAKLELAVHIPGLTDLPHADYRRIEMTEWRLRRENEREMHRLKTELARWDEEIRRIRNGD